MRMEFLYFTKGHSVVLSIAEVFPAFAIILYGRDSVEIRFILYYAVEI